VILTLFKEAGSDFVAAVLLSFRWIGCQFSHHDWYEYVDDWGDGDIEVSVECSRCQTKP